MRKVINDKFSIAYDGDDRYRVVDWRGTESVGGGVWETTETYTQIEALTLMWALEADPKRADQGYIEWRQG